MSDPNVVVARNTDKAPVSDLYSQTVAFSHYNNLSAQLPIDPELAQACDEGRAEDFKQDYLADTCKMINALMKVQD